MDPDPGTKRAGATNQQQDPEEPHLRDSVQMWIHRIERRLPEGSVLVATIQKNANNTFLAFFRAESEGETFISEVRDPDPDRAVDQAGFHLYERLGEEESEHPTLKQRFRDLFSEAA